MASDTQTAAAGTPPSGTTSADVTASATLQTLVSFDGTDGSQPRGGLVTDAAGNLYGTTLDGGRFDYGTVFEIAKTATGYSPTPTTLVSFNGTDGYSPGENLLTDAKGDLIGTTRGLVGQGPGPSVRGTIFEVAKTGTGFSAKPTTLVHFRAHGGFFPNGTLTTDAKGDIFGTTGNGPRPKDAFGTVFEVTKTAHGYRPRQTLLARFDQLDAATSQPTGNLVLDSSGNIFGTTRLGGPSGNGEVFELAKTRTGYSSKPTDIADVGDADFLTTDKAGNIFGTSELGPSGDGSVFEISKTGTGYSTTTLATFDGATPSDPRSLAFDAAGDLYGTTYSGGSFGKGSVFEIAKTATGYAAAPTTVYSFSGADGSAPIGILSFDAAGNLYGTTALGGAANAGTVFELTPGGTVTAGALSDAAAPAPCFCEGTRIRTQAGDVPVEALAVGDLVATASGALRPVVWLGRRTVDCRRHPRPHEVRPIRIAADAFGPSRPARDPRRLARPRDLRRCGGRGADPRRRARRRARHRAARGRAHDLLARRARRPRHPARREPARRELPRDGQSRVLHRRRGRRAGGGSRRAGADAGRLLPAVPR